MHKEILATEILHELNATCNRWFIAFIIVLVLWFATIGVFIWYISLPVEFTDVSIDQVQTDVDRSYNQVIGGDYDGYEQTDSSDTEGTPRTAE